MAEKKDGEDFDTDYMDETVCPYCGEENGDSWELGIGGGNQNQEGATHCGSCGKLFRWERHHEVTYSTTKVEEKKP